MQRNLMPRSSRLPKKFSLSTAIHQKKKRVASQDSSLVPRKKLCNQDTKSLAETHSQVSCPACTFKNRGTNSVCEICQTILSEVDGHQSLSETNTGDVPKQHSTASRNASSSTTSTKESKRTSKIDVTSIRSFFHSAVTPKLKGRNIRKKPTKPQYSGHSYVQLCSSNIPDRLRCALCRGASLQPSPPHLDSSFISASNSSRLSSQDGSSPILISCQIVGNRFCAADVPSIGTRVYLQREPENLKDPLAIRVLRSATELKQSSDMDFNFDTDADTANREMLVDNSGESRNKLVCSDAMEPIGHIPARVASFLAVLLDLKACDAQAWICERPAKLNPGQDDDCNEDISIDDGNDGDDEGNNSDGVKIGLQSENNNDANDGAEHHPVGSGRRESQNDEKKSNVDTHHMLQISLKIRRDVNLKRTMDENRMTACLQRAQRYASIGHTKSNLNIQVFWSKVDTVLARFSHLFTSLELAILEQFKALTMHSQQAILKLLTRKHATERWFRRNKLKVSKGSQSKMDLDELLTNHRLPVVQEGSGVQMKRFSSFNFLVQWPTDDGNVSTQANRRALLQSEIVPCILDEPEMTSQMLACLRDELNIKSNKSTAHNKQNHDVDHRTPKQRLRQIILEYLLNQRTVCLAGKSPPLIEHRKVAQFVLKVSGPWIQIDARFGMLCKFINTLFFLSQNIVTTSDSSLIVLERLGYTRFFQPKFTTVSLNRNSSAIFCRRECFLSFIEAQDLLALLEELGDEVAASTSMNFKSKRQLKSKIYSAEPINPLSVIIEAWLRLEMDIKKPHSSLHRSYAVKRTGKPRDESKDELGLGDIILACQFCTHERSVPPHHFLDRKAKKNPISFSNILNTDLLSRLRCEVCSEMNWPPSEPICIFQQCNCIDQSSNVDGIDSRDISHEEHIQQKESDDTSCCCPMPPQASFLFRYRAVHIYATICHYGIRLLEAEKLYELASLLLIRLLSLPFCAHRRGYWWNRLVINLRHLSNRSAANVSPNFIRLTVFDLCLRGYQDSHVRTGDREELRHRLITAMKNKYVNQRRELPETVRRHCELEQKDDGRVVIDKMHGIPTNCEIGMKSRFFDHNNEMGSVESLVLVHYGQARNGSWEGMHCENTLFQTLFGLLMWDCIFDQSVPLAFLSAYQNAPLDLECDSFHQNRKEQIRSQVDKIRSSCACMSRRRSEPSADFDLTCKGATIVDTSHLKSAHASLFLRSNCPDCSAHTLFSLLETSWNYRGTRCRGVNWERWSLLDLSMMAACVGPAALAALCLRISKDYRNWCRGLPDLFLWRWTKEMQNTSRENSKIDDSLNCCFALEGECVLVEVKGPRDRLSYQQKAWLRFLAQYLPTRKMEVFENMDLDSQIPPSM